MMSAVLFAARRTPTVLQHVHMLVANFKNSFCLCRAERDPARHFFSKPVSNNVNSGTRYCPRHFGRKTWPRTRKRCLSMRFVTLFLVCLSRRRFTCRRKCSTSTFLSRDRSVPSMGVMTSIFSACGRYRVPRDVYPWPREPMPNCFLLDKQRQRADVFLNYYTTPCCQTKPAPLRRTG